MARPIRVEFADAVYHVPARGNQRKAIYRDDQDRQRFLQTTEEVHDRFARGKRRAPSREAIGFEAFLAPTWAIS